MEQNSLSGKLPSPRPANDTLLRREDVQCDEEDREDDKEESEDAPSYFYRIEFQARGAPHAELQKAAFTAHINVLRFPVCANFTQNAR